MPAFRSAAAALLGYALVAVIFAWPLPRHLETQLPGPIAGDTAVYVWNTWIFRHEITAHHSSPLRTSHILAPLPSTDLSLHNYSLFADALAFPLIPRVGVVAAFNVVCLALVVLSAWAMFLLAWTVTGHAGAAWLGGAAFGFSPVLSARALGHFSMVGAAPLPIFLLFLLRASERRRLIDAAAAGAAMGWAALNDLYYGVYCVLLAAAWVLINRIGITRATNPTPTARRLRWAAGVVTLTLLGVCAAIALSGGTGLRVGTVFLSMRTLHTPVLLLTISAVGWAALHVRPARRRSGVLPWPQVAGLAASAAVTCAVILAPLLPGVLERLGGGEKLAPKVFWRSSPPGVDLLAFFLPNPMNPMVGDRPRAWLQSLPNGMVENTASLPIVALVMIAVAVWRTGYVLPRFWAGLTVVAAALALGPFLRIGGVNTFVPGPWALIRYVPVIASARMPGRLAVVVTLSTAVLFAAATAHLLARHPRPRLVGFLVAGALLLELSTVPRAGYDASVPAIYRTILDDGREVRVLELPFGIKDGVAALGAFDPVSQYYQTFHEKPVFGGYISRLPPTALGEHERHPVLKTLAALSSGGSGEGLDRTVRERDDSRQAARDLQVGYVVIDSARVSPALRAFAVETFALVKIAESDGRELYRPRIPPS